MKARLSLIIASAAAAALTPAQAQVAFDGDYSQEFDALATTGTGNANAWTDNVTLKGWYSSRTTYNAGTGSNNDGSLYSFGASGVTERALGSVASGGSGTIGYGLRLENTSVDTLESIVVSYIGEQWRSGGPSSLAQTLTFSYNIGVNLSLGVVAGWTTFAALDFTSPVFGSAVGAVNGNSTANQVDLSATLTGISLAPGQELFLRWQDVDHTGSDHGLAIDSFNVSALTAVPEPATWALLGGGLLFFASRLRRRT